MKINDRLREDKIHISFEVFPPKTDEGFDNVIHAVDEIARLEPAFISVTYGAGGGTSRNTAKIAAHIKNDLNMLSLAHLTCASSTKTEVREVIEHLKSLGLRISSPCAGIFRRICFPRQQTGSAMPLSWWKRSEDMVTSALEQRAIRKDMWRTNTKKMISDI